VFKKIFLTLVLSLTVGVEAHAQTTDTLYTPRPLLKGADALLIVGFVAAAAAVSPADKYLTQRLQDPARQSNRILHTGATFFRLIGDPGSLVVGGLTYGVGRVKGSRRAEDIGLHSVEAILLSGAITGVTKVVAGRARPYKDTANSRNFGLFRGFRNGDYESFPSGHTTSAFAFATIISAETSHWWPAPGFLASTTSFTGQATSLPARRSGRSPESRSTGIRTHIRTIESTSTSSEPVCRCHRDRVGFLCCRLPPDNRCRRTAFS